MPAVGGVEGDGCRGEQSLVKDGKVLVCKLLELWDMLYANDGTCFAEHKSHACGKIATSCTDVECRGTGCENGGEKFEGHGMHVWGGYGGGAGESVGCILVGIGGVWREEDGAIYGTHGCFDRGCADEMCGF